MLTKYEEELRKAEAYVAELKTKIAAEEASRTKTSFATRQLAVALHSALCPRSHPGECNWHFMENPDDPDRAEWDNEAHRFWLKNIEVGLTEARAIGFTVQEPF